MNLTERAREAKDKIPIADLVGMTEPITRTGGQYEKGVKHDSLVIDTYKGSWFWNSRAQAGDHISWVQNYVIPSASFRDAVEYLESLVGGIDLIAPSKRDVEQSKPVKKLDIAVALNYHQNLAKSPSAQQWWVNRGITTESIDRWFLGYKPNHWGKGPASSIPLTENGVLRTIRHRIWNASDDDARYLPEEKGLGAWIFNIDELDSEPPEIVIFEGEIKCMVMCQLGERGIGISGCQNMPLRYLNTLAKLPVVYVCLDPVLNSEKPISPYNLRWVQELSALTQVKLMRVAEKVDDMVLKFTHGFDAYKSAKRNAKIVTKQDIEAANRKRVS